MRAVIPLLATSSYNGGNSDDGLGHTPIAATAKDALQHCCMITAPNTYLNILKDVSRIPADGTPWQLMEVCCAIFVQTNAIHDVPCHRLLGAQVLRFVRSLTPDIHILSAGPKPHCSVTCVEDGQLTAGHAGGHVWAASRGGGGGRELDG